MSRRETSDYAERVWGVPISLGSVHRIEQQVSAALEDAYSESWNAIREASVRNLDETGWRQGGERSWLWVAVSKNATGFKLARRRGQDVVLEQFGEALETGYFVSDRWRAYNVVDMKRRGVCHAHLNRDFVKIEEQGGKAGALGTKALALHERMFRLVNRWRAGEIGYEAFERNLKPIKLGMRKVLQSGEQCRNKKVRGMCADMLRHWPALWNFASVPGLEPTNNSAERALRKAVLWRKGSFGTQSQTGNQFVERILTVTETCRQNGRRLIDFLTSAVRAAMLQEPAPKLLPDPGGGG
jgi:transposase